MSAPFKFLPNNGRFIRCVNDLIMYVMYYVLTNLTSLHMYNVSLALPLSFYHLSPSVCMRYCMCIR